jgi:hypothetical protein
MATKWPESVRTSGKLLVWANQTAKAGWSVALERAIKEFNRATHTRKLALRFEPGLGNPVLWVCPEAAQQRRPTRGRPNLPYRSGRTRVDVSLS